MSRRALTLPIRTLSPAIQRPPQWICKRCLATETQDTTPIPPTHTAKSSSAAIPNYDPSLPASKRIGPDGTPYRLTTTDYYLKKTLRQPEIPAAYLQHSTSEILPEAERKQREKTVSHDKIMGVVVSAGKMAKTVRVRVERQTWNKRIKKYFQSHENFLTHDPNNSLLEGDVVELHRLKVSKHVQHVVGSVISPFGKPLDERPPIPTADDMLAQYKAKRLKKLRRRDLRVKAARGSTKAIQELKNLGIDLGDGIEADEGNKGQKLPAGVLPGGKHEVGKINARARHNKEKTMKFDAQAEDSLLEAKEKGEELEQKHDLTSDSAFR